MLELINRQIEFSRKKLLPVAAIDISLSASCIPPKSFDRLQIMLMKYKYKTDATQTKMRHKHKSKPPKSLDRLQIMLMKQTNTNTSQIQKAKFAPLSILEFDHFDCQG